MVVGQGLIGAAVRDRLAAAGHPVVAVSRRTDVGGRQQSTDISTARGRRELGDLLATGPRQVILVHGPGDVTWINNNEQQAHETHCGVAEVVAESGVPALLVSTDNLFPGDRGGYRPTDQVRPSNAYGRVKADAERILLDGGASLALRVSLVYGWGGSTGRVSYAQRCLAAALAGIRMSAPTDQHFTPIHLTDVASVIAACGTASKPVVGVRHLAGPDELSRLDFARLAYELAGADPDLVVPCLRAETDLASRPRYSALAGSDFSDVGGLAGWAPLDPRDGLSAMLQEIGRRPAIRQ
ncbi:sugar nucleotide-binding protein [Polymorphospora rubra]|uniref:SDR family oxidoreductase n=1 Tax=Polymorphospora rubra TaxID=338584 RepID=UPI0033DD61A0